MEMDHLIGQRFNLISKSEIRYVGTLHEINPENATIALEDVYSYGTENRRTGADFIPASQQKFEYIVFRGSDVKDIKVLEEEKENQQPSPPLNVPNDPAILNATRPPPSGTPSGPPHNRSQNQPTPGYPQHNQFPPNYYNQYGGGRGGFGPPPGGYGPGPGFQGGMPYGPPPGQAPPGWFGPPSNPFPQPPGQNQFPPGPVGAPGQRPHGLQQNQQQQAPPQGPPYLTSELPAVDEKVHVKLPTNNAVAPSVPPPQIAPTPPVDSKPTVSEALAPNQVPNAPTDSSSYPPTVKPPTGPKSSRIQPAVPLPTAPKAAANVNPPIKTTSNGPLAASAGNVTQPSTTVASASNLAPTKPVANSAGMQEATRAATAAVAAAMAKLSQPDAQSKKAADTNTAMDALTKKVSEMRTSSDASAPRGRGTPFNRGRGRGAYQNRKMEIPKTDFDFETANAKFNKEDLIKEAIATGSPIGDSTPDESLNGISESPAMNGSTETRKDSLQSAGVSMYNKSSFFDNISSDLKDREAANTKVGGNAEGGFGGRERRGEEIRRNIETFGQGSVDGGFRGRGRGRGYRGGYNSRGGGYRGRGGGYGYGQQQRGYGQRGGGYAGPRRTDDQGVSQS